MKNTMQTIPFHAYVHWDPVDNSENPETAQVLDNR